MRIVLLLAAAVGAVATGASAAPACVNWKTCLRHPLATVYIHAVCTGPCSNKQPVPIQTNLKPIVPPTLD